MLTERNRLVRRARLLAWLGVGWHGIEAAVAFAAGVAAGSIALVGFGADSLVEGGAGLVLIWRFAATRTGSEAAEHRAQRLIGASFCAYLSAALLVGLGGNALLGLWWLDPGVALLIAGVAVREGREAWHGESCC